MHNREEGQAITKRLNGRANVINNGSEYYKLMFYMIQLNIDHYKHVNDKAMQINKILFSGRFF